MWFERALRRLKVGKRASIAVLALVLPMTVLIGITVATIEGEETELRDALDEAVDVLVPLATLEYDLQRALTDELEAESGESVPDFDGLTISIDRVFTQLRSASGDSDMIDDAQKAWQSARPTVARLVKHVTPLRMQGDSKATRTVRAELDRALRDIDEARSHLGRAVRSQVAAAQSAERRQLRILVWTWAGTLLAAAAVMAGLVYTIVRPVRELGRAVHRLSSGDLSARINDRSSDELAEVAAYLDAMAARFAVRRAELENDALRDTLTQLPNRRAIMATLENALSASRLGGPVSVLMIDVDHFKSVNDRFGHAAGDEALVWLADRMRGALRQGDALGRYAGDEYLAILPETSDELARQVAERLCEAINGEAEANPRKPSVTIGAATAPRDGESAVDLIRAADQALYRGKDLGRGRVVLARA